MRKIPLDTNLPQVLEIEADPRGYIDADMIKRMWAVGEIIARSQPQTYLDSISTDRDIRLNEVVRYDQSKAFHNFLRLTFGWGFMDKFGEVKDFFRGFNKNKELAEFHSIFLKDNIDLNVDCKGSLRKSTNLKTWVGYDLNEDKKVISSAIGTPEYTDSFREKGGVFLAGPVSIVGDVDIEFEGLKKRVYVHGKEVVFLEEDRSWGFLNSDSNTVEKIGNFDWEVYLPTVESERHSLDGKFLYRRDLIKSLRTSKGYLSSLKTGLEIDRPMMHVSGGLEYNCINDPDSLDPIGLRFTFESYNWEIFSPGALRNLYATLLPPKLIAMARQQYSEAGDGSENLNLTELTEATKLTSFADRTLGSFKQLSTI